VASEFGLEYIGGSFYRFSVLLGPANATDTSFIFVTCTFWSLFDSQLICWLSCAG